MPREADEASIQIAETRLGPTQYAIRGAGSPVHGSVDTDVTPDHSQHAHATIPNAELITLDGGTHLAFYTHPDAVRVQRRAIELLRS